jgi:hypothetical protein
VPESFILSKRKARDVVKQISVFDKYASENLLAGGFVTAFLDIIESDEDVVNLLKAIDMRLNMLMTSSANYTTVLPQWLGFYDNSLECLNKYE